MKKGKFCISFDTELLWGRRAGHYEEYVQRAKKERKIIQDILHLFEKYDIKATWAVVGHLFLNSCKKENNVKHPEIVRFRLSSLREDWFLPDPSSSLKQDPLWYGEDIIALLQKVQGQEIGSHSFSHINFGDPGCTKACAESEIAACVALAKKRNIHLSSFVFPWNSVGYLSLLKKYGFTNFRSPEPSGYKSMGRLGTLIMGIELLLPTSPSVSIPFNFKGLVAIPGSMYFPSARGVRKYIPKNVRYQKAKRGIDRAISEGKIFHLWTHPIDFSDSTRSLLDDFEKIIKYAAKRRDENHLDINTMHEIANEYKHEK